MPGRKPRTLREEIRQSKPFQSPAQEAILALYRTTDQLQRRFSKLVEPHGISLQQYNVLRILRGAGETGLPTLDVADRMIEQTPGVTRLLDKLESKKLVRRERRSDDRRQVMCWITQEGLELLRALDRPVAAAGIHAMQPLASSEQRLLIRMLARVRGRQR